MLASQYTFRINYVNYDKSIEQANDYIKNANYLDFYVTDAAMFYYLPLTFENKTAIKLDRLVPFFKGHNLSYYDQKINKNVNVLGESYADAQINQKNKGYIYIIFQNLMFGKEQIKKIEENCTLEKIYYTNNYESLRIYKC